MRRLLLNARISDASNKQKMFSRLFLCLTNSLLEGGERERNKVVWRGEGTGSARAHGARGVGCAPAARSREGGENRGIHAKKACFLACHTMFQRKFGDECL